MRRINLLIILSTAILFHACQQKATLPESTTPMGVHYEILKEGNGNKASVGEFVEVHFKYISENDSAFYNTFKTAPIYYHVIEPLSYGDPMDWLSVLNEGDSAIFYLPTDSLFKKSTPPNFIKYGEYVYATVKLKKVLNELEYKSVLAARQKQRLENELMVIRQYLETNGITDYTESEEGIIYTTEVEGEGNSPVSGDKVSVHYTGKLLNGTQFDSSLDRGSPLEFIIDESSVIKGWHQGVPKFKKGGKGTLYLPPSLGYGKEGGGLIPPDAPLIFDIEVVDIIDPLANIKADLKIIEDYLAARNITAIKSPDHFYYKTDIEGNGIFPVEGQTVKVHYRGTLLNGTQFDASYDRGTPYKFIIGRGQVIKGWDLGIPMFSSGGKGTIYLPSDLAYGERGSGSIPPNNCLIFDIEIIGIN